MKYLVIETSEDLKRACEFFATKEVLGIDTETTAFEPRHGRLRLIQISDGVKTIVIDVFKVLENEGIFAKAIKTTKELMKAFGKVIRRIFAPLREILENPAIKKVIHNFKFEEKWLFTTCNIRCKGVFDTFLAAQIIDYNDIKDPDRGHKLSVVMRRYVGADLDKTEQASNWAEWDLTSEQYEYAALDVYYLPKLRGALLQELINNNLIKVAQLEFECAPVIAHVEMAGLKVNREIYEAEIVNLKILREEAEGYLQTQVKKEGQPIQGSMFGLPDKDYNNVLLTSSAQMKDALNAKDIPVFSKKEIELFDKYTKEKKFLEALPINERLVAMKERYPKFNNVLYDKYCLAKKEGKQIIQGTGKKAIQNIGKDYEVVGILKDFRGVEKMVSTYGEPFLAYLEGEADDERVYSNFYQQGAPTGRMSSNNPNVQNIPDKEIEVGGKKYQLGFRRAFDAPRGRSLINADYSQIELRVVAEMSCDPIFMDAFIAGKDLHADTASRIFNVPYELCALDGHEYYKNYRKPSKNINFGIVYGIGAGALAGMIDKSEEEAQDMINKYALAYPTLWAYLRQNYRNAISRLWAKTLSGRTQRFTPPTKDSFGKPNGSEASLIGRNGMNMPIQGCLEGSSRILVNGVGYKKIEDVSKEKHLVWDGKKVVSGFVTVSGLKQLCVVSLSNGVQVNCSPNHKFYTYEKGTGYNWTEAKDLQRKHRVFLTENSFEFDYLNLSCYDYLNKVPSEDIGTLSAIIYLFQDEDEDGTINIPYDEFELNREFSRILKATGIGFTDEEVFNSYFKNRIKYNIDNSFFSEMDEFIIKDSLPESFWTSKSLIKSFLTTLFNFSTIGKEQFSIRVENSRKQVLIDLQQALLLFGINSSLNNGLLSARLFLTKDDACRFASKIGITVMNKLLKGFKTKRLLNLSYNKYYEMRHVKVTNVQITDEFVEMFDVADSDTHQFMTNGVITHNTSADILKRALKLLHDELRAFENANIVNIVHDEIMVECDTKDEEAVREKVENCMIGAGEEYLSKVPVKVDAKIVKDWADK